MTKTRSIQLLFWAATGMLAGQLGTPNNTVTVLRNFNGQPVPKWERGHVLSIDLAQPVVYAHDRTGREEFHTTISIPGSSRVMIRDVAASANGGFAVGATAVSPDGAVAALLVLLDSGGHISKVIRTSPVAIKCLRYADNGTLWAVVREFDDQFRELPDHDMLRWYDPSGTLLGHVVNRQSISKDKHEPAPQPFLTTSPDRIGFYADRANIWTEVSLQGKVLGQWQFPVSTQEFSVRIAGVLLTPLDNVLVNAVYSYKDGHKIDGLYSFSRKTGSFTQVDTAPVSNLPVSLFGIDGGSLVFRQSPNLLWVAWDQNR
jgi:hypothetical protein